MAFIAATPKFSFLQSSTKLSHVRPATRYQIRTAARQAIRADTEQPSSTTTTKGPIPPANFKAPEPRRGYVKPEQALDVAGAAVGTLVRLASGALIEGYRADPSGGKLTETSATLPKTRPAQPLRLFEFEACPFCRKVREAVSVLDLDVYVFPCPRGSVVYREYVKAKGGKSMFPYLEDPNTGFESYESMDIIGYLYRTYGPQGGRVPPVGNVANTLTAGVATLFRRGKGSMRESKTVPAPKALELYGYEASPFSKFVRERMVELELPYLYHTTPRGSTTRDELKEVTGIVQTPYLIDPNTGISMFESADIVQYLTDTYGPNAPGAVEKMERGDVFLPAFMGSEVAEGSDVTPSLDPEQGKDKALEEYCKDNPEADECRNYDS